MPKLTDYLLSGTHPKGKFKARYLAALGFDNLNASELEQSLMQIASGEEVTEETHTRHGTKYVVDGRLTGRSGRSGLFRTVWIVDAGASRPRFVTAHPL